LPWNIATQQIVDAAYIARVPLPTQSLAQPRFSSHANQQDTFDVLDQ
jgi:hypothetical protein